MATPSKAKKPAGKPRAARATTPKTKVAAAPKRPAAPKARPVTLSVPRKQTQAAQQTLEMRAILLITLFIALCILFAQLYARNSY